MVGVGGDAMVKFFDLRMHNTYSYLNGAFSPVSPPAGKFSTKKSRWGSSIIYPRKDYSVFLSHPPPSHSNSNRAHPRCNKNANSRLSYHGPIYSMSSPSALPPTIYAGVVNGIFRLDFVSADDLTSPSHQWHEDNIALDVNAEINAAVPGPDRVVKLSGYERPEASNTTTTSKLRTQKYFLPGLNSDDANEVESGWDRRWESLDWDAPWRRD